MTQQLKGKAAGNQKQGLYAVIAAIAIQLSLGTAYIWSVFQTGVANSIFGGNNAAAALTFSVLLFTMTVGSAIGGKLAAKYSTRIVVFTGGVILSAGFFFAAFVTPEYSWTLWLTYGLMGGIGMGFTYSTTIACAQKWYPHKRGLVTGIIVAALGFGGVVLTPVVERLITVFGGAGAGEPNTFMVLSALFLIVCTAGSIFQKPPPEGYMADTAAGSKSAAVNMMRINGNDAKSYSSSEMLKTPHFYLMAATLMLACMGGLMMMGFAKPIAVAKGLEATATMGVLAITMFNSFGRLFWGMISDRLGRINTIIILLAGNAVLSLLINAVSGYLIYGLIAVIGFFYGGLLSNFPALTADIFGAKHMATNYGFVLLGFGIGAIISSQIAGHFKNIAEYDISLMFPAFVIASCCAAAGIIMMFILKSVTKPKS
jgi:OFA family oxalate/formate antiporter-like MFS transporter